MGEFIVTEGFSAAGEAGERQVVEALKDGLAQRKREYVGYWRYPLNTARNNLREPDILLLDQEWGVVIIEVKSIPLTQIGGIQGYSWRLNTPYFGRSEINPYEQARGQAQAIIERVRSHPQLAAVPVRALVALPLVSRDDWEKGGQAFLFSDTPLLFGDELTPAAIERRIDRAPTIRRGQPLDDELFQTLLSAFGTGGSLPVSRAAETALPLHTPAATLPRPRKVDLLALAAEQRRNFDVQQEQIAKTIPPGAQRIRGIAGSGKTVLLAQKAANMHLRHPDWDIALVFFCRSLYEQMQTQLDHWLRVASNDETGYADARHKVRVLHAWGSRDQAGFYRTLAQHCGLNPLSADDVKQAHGGRAQSPTAGVLYSARELLRLAEEGGHDLQMFDAVLIDEGQDLVDERQDLKFGDRQAFYWLAYRSLRPVQQEKPLLGEALPEDTQAAQMHARRLIWAYDEAQSLDSLVVPRARDLFGEELAQLLTGGTQYQGGIQKNEVMKRCYRTPGPLLVAAHALGMGLLREGGMVAGLTTRKGWEDIGYEVEGELRSGRTVSLYRPAHNSPNLLPKLSRSPLIEFHDYGTRGEELQALSGRILSALNEDGLALDRQLVICLGQYASRAVEVTYHALRAAGIDVYVAANQNGNTPPATQWQGQNRNGFRLPAHVTVSNVARAKGNEADLVHIVGLDEVGRAEDQVSVRNQLFVALSRSRGWASLSGTNIAPGFRDEVMRVLGSGERLTFTMNQPRRNLNDESGPETLAAD
jgi:superfamily I DNA and RNA helicase